MGHESQRNDGPSAQAETDCRTTSLNCASFGGNLPSGSSAHVHPPLRFSVTSPLLAADERPISSVAPSNLRADGRPSLGRLAAPDREQSAYSNEQRQGGRGVERGRDSRSRGASPRRSTPTGPRSPDRRPSDSWRPAPEDLPALDRRASRERPPHLGRRSRSRSPLRASSSYRPTSMDEPASSARASDCQRSIVRSSRTRTPPPPITSGPTSFLGPSYNPAVTSLLGADVNRVISSIAPMRRWGGSACDGGGASGGQGTVTKVEDTPVTATESRTVSLFFCPSCLPDCFGLLTLSM